MNNSFPVDDTLLIAADGKWHTIANHVEVSDTLELKASSPTKRLLTSRKPLKLLGIQITIKLMKRFCQYF